MDAERSTEGVEMLGRVDLRQVDVDGERAAIAPNGALETILHPWQLFIPAELGVRNQT